MRWVDLLVSPTHLSCHLGELGTSKQTSPSPCLSQEEAHLSLTSSVVSARFLEKISLEGSKLCFSRNFQKKVLLFFLSFLKARDIVLLSHLFFFIKGPRCHQSLANGFGLLVCEVGLLGWGRGGALVQPAGRWAHLCRGSVCRWHHRPHEWEMQMQVQPEAQPPTRGRPTSHHSRLCP